MRKGGIKPITNLFEKYAKLLVAPQSTVVLTAVEVIKDLCGFEVQKSALRYSPQSKVLTITVPGPQKSEILMRRSEILAHIEGRVGSKSAPKSIL